MRALLKQGLQFLRDVEGHVRQRPELLELGAGALQERALEGLVAVLVDPEALGHVRDGDGVRHHSSSTIRADKRLKTRTPRA